MRKIKKTDTVITNLKPDWVNSKGQFRASSNKPSLVVVTESPTSDERKKKIFDFIDDLLQKTGKIGEYDQKI